MALVVFLQENEDALSVYINLKIFCETAPWLSPGLVLPPGGASPPPHPAGWSWSAVALYSGNLHDPPTVTKNQQ